jgi:class 3 adenylate cyclase
MDIAAAVCAERLGGIMGELVEHAEAVVQRFGGTVDKFTGDGLMAVFGAVSCDGEFAWFRRAYHLGVGNGVMQ